MIDDVTIQLALRSRVLGLAVCATGGVALAATSLGYTRASGSFLADGFRAGMELAGAGFAAAANNAAKEATSVTDLAIICPGCVAEASGTRTLSVGIPATRGLENVQAARAAGRPFWEEDYIPGPATVTTIGPFGRIVATPLYRLKVYGLANRGIAGLGGYAKALAALFPSELIIPIGAGDVLRVRGDQGPYAGEQMPDAPGWAVIPVTIPLRLYTLNSI